MRKLLFLLMTLVFSHYLVSCSSDDDCEDALANEIQSKLDIMVRESLVGEHVLFTKVTVNSVDKTLLERGCPTRLFFSWKEDSLIVSIPDLKIGNMPFAISYESTCTITLLNNWEEDEHVGGNESWFKFVGTNGSVSTGDGLKPNGSSIKGYFRPATKTIEFVIDYNVMNVRTVCERQTLDDPQIGDFDTEMAKYMEDLLAYKKENGLIVVPTPVPDEPSRDYPIVLPDSLDFFSPTDSPDGTPGTGGGMITKPDGIKDMVVSLEGVKGMLSGDIVLKSDVMVSGQVMATACPAVMNFDWSEDVMTLKIDNLHFGKMPFAINFSCDCKRVNLSYDDLANYSSLWYKFEGNYGVVSSDPEFIEGNEGVVRCYFDPLTVQIALYIDFGTDYNVLVGCPKQPVVYD